VKRRSHSARTRRAGAVATIACFGAALSLPAGAPAQVASGAASGTTARLHPAATASPGEARRVLRYWTAERMRSAEPLDAALAGSGKGEPFAHASFAPVATPTTPPFSFNGRLFVRQGRARGFCSATAVNSPSRRLVITAAHCLNSGPRSLRGNSVWSRYVEFVPAYSNGTAPFGVFVARRNTVFVPRQWERFGNPNFDVGALLVEPNAEGTNVANAVGGGAALLTDTTRRQTFQTFGYPGKSRVMQGCESPYVGDDSLTYRIPGPPTIAIRCHWAPGASGGGWLTEGGTVINGVTSYGKRQDRVHTFSPYFSASNVGRLVAGF
jgi:V8-like Glu-specific endopeptidase